MVMDFAMYVGNRLVPDRDGMAPKAKVVRGMANPAPQLLPGTKAMAPRHDVAGGKNGFYRNLLDSQQRMRLYFEEIL
jgi:hypothetical protein